jgi:hypothetical protein
MKMNFENESFEDGDNYQHGTDSCDIFAEHVRTSASLSLS